MSRGGAVAARVAHNHEVPGSSPGPATKIKGLPKGSPFFLVGVQGENLSAPPSRFANSHRANYMPSPIFLTKNKLLGKTGAKLYSWPRYQSKRLSRKAGSFTLVMEAGSWTEPDLLRSQVRHASGSASWRIGNEPSLENSRSP